MGVPILLSTMATVAAFARSEETDAIFHYEACINRKVAFRTSNNPNPKPQVLIVEPGRQAKMSCDIW